MKASVVFGVSALALTLATSSFADQSNQNKTKTTNHKHGVKVENKDNDLDTSVSTSKTSTTTTTAANYDSRRDVVESRAESRRDERGERWTLAPQIGAATGGYGAAVGVRAGYTFRTPIYLGGNFMYHGGTDNPTSPGRSWYPSVEVGYDVGMGPVLFRPYAGVGYIMRDNNSDAGLVYPGVTVAYLIPDSPVFIGADGRVLLPLEGGDRAVAISGTAGVNF